MPTLSACIKTATVPHWYVQSKQYQQGGTVQDAADDHRTSGKTLLCTLTVPCTLGSHRNAKMLPCTHFVWTHALNMLPVMQVGWRSEDEWMNEYRDDAGRLIQEPDAASARPRMAPEDEALIQVSLSRSNCQQQERSPSHHRRHPSACAPSLA